VHVFDCTTLSNQVLATIGQAFVSAQTLMEEEVPEEYLDDEYEECSVDSYADAGCGEIGSQDGEVQYEEGEGPGGDYEVAVGYRPHGAGYTSASAGYGKGRYEQPDSTEYQGVPEYEEAVGGSNGLGADSTYEAVNYGDMGTERDPMLAQYTAVTAGKPYESMDGDYRARPGMKMVSVARLYLFIELYL
jgi:hypothetical protein